MDIKQLIKELIEDELLGTDSFLVDVKTNESGTDLRFFIDGKNGIDINVCSKLSRKVSRVLDEEYTDDTPIRYEISSPGVDQPLIDKRQYHQHLGRELDIETTNEQSVEGELIRVEENGIVLKVKKSKKENIDQILSFDDIKKSIVKISFKRKKK